MPVTRPFGPVNPNLVASPATVQRGVNSGGGDAGWCAKCGAHVPEGDDTCLGHIDGVHGACCGHGVRAPYVVLSLDMARTLGIRGEVRHSISGWDGIKIEGEAAQTILDFLVARARH